MMTSAGAMYDTTTAGYSSVHDGKYHSYHSCSSPPSPSNTAPGGGKNMSIIDRRPPNSPAPVMVRTEEIGNVEDAYPIGAITEHREGCRLSSTPTPKKEVHTMTNNSSSRARIEALKEETAALRLKAVKTAIETGTQIYENRQKAEEQALNDLVKKSGLHFVD